MRFLFPLFSLLLFLAAGCSKDDKGFSGHCDGLQQDNLPAADPARIYIASAFTPNGDGINDYFVPQLYSIASIDLKIYDKDGAHIYHTIDPLWLPLFAPEGAELYYYRLEAVTSSGKRIGRCGEVYALECFPPGRERSSFTFQDQITASGFTAVTSETISTCP